MTLLAIPPTVPWDPNRPHPKPYPPTGPQLTQPRPGDESNPTPQPPPTPKVGWGL